MKIKSTVLGSRLPIGLARKLLLVDGSKIIRVSDYKEVQSGIYYNGKYWRVSDLVRLF